MTTIDDFLPAWLWYWITASRDEYSYELVDEEGGKAKHEADLSPSVTEHIKKTYESKVGPTVGHLRCTIVRAEPGYWYPVHADHKSKLVSSVLYLWPDHSDGTDFVHDDDVTWQTNRLVTWRNEGQLHQYRNSTDECRYTINIYQQVVDRRLGVA